MVKILFPKGRYMLNISAAGGLLERQKKKNKERKAWNHPLRTLQNYTQFLRITTLSSLNFLLSFLTFSSRQFDDQTLERGHVSPIPHVLFLTLSKSQPFAYYSQYTKSQSFPYYSQHTIIISHRLKHNFPHFFFLLFYVAMIQRKHKFSRAEKKKGKVAGKQASPAHTLGTLSGQLCRWPHPFSAGPPLSFTDKPMKQTNKCY